MTITLLKQQLEQGKKTSVQLVEEALHVHEKELDKNAMGVISPYALLVAKERDEERKKGIIRGPLHGIPIVIKDNIMYRDGTPTTANSYALHDFIPPFNATIVNDLIDAGAIILGKANLSEWAYFMSYDNMPSGFGSMYGQVKHPFDEKVDPYGSSTGSAVAVKLGIVSAAIGTETNGSLMAPAYQCQIISYKPTFGLVSKHGIIPISPTQDTAGPMANTVLDCALLMNVINHIDPHDSTTLKHEHRLFDLDQMKKPIHPSTIGFMMIKGHTYSEDEQSIMMSAKRRCHALGHMTIDIELEKAQLHNDPTLLVEFKYALNAFFQQVQGSTQVKSLQDVIQFNQKHERRCLTYGQSILIASENTSGDLNDPEYLKTRQSLLHEAQLLESIMKEQGLLALAAPVWLGFAPIYGNPSICIPEGVYQGQPKAMVFVGKIDDDEMLLRFAHHYEQIQKEDHATLNP